MARVDEDAMLGIESTLIFIACNVGEARRAEALLTEEGVDYFLSFEPFVRAGVLAVLFGASECVGVGFHVRSEQAGSCRDALGRHGLRTGIVDPDSDP